MTYYRPKINGKWASTVWFSSEFDARQFVQLTRGHEPKGLKIVTDNNPKTKRQLSTMF